MFGKNRQQQLHIQTLQRRVRELEALVDTLAQRAGVGDAELLQLREKTLPGITPQVRTLVAEGRVIEAIKVYRQNTGIGLVEAKKVIDEYRAMNP